MLRCLRTGIYCYLLGEVPYFWGVLSTKWRIVTFGATHVSRQCALSLRRFANVEPHGFTAVASAFAEASAFAKASADRSADKSCEGG